MGFEEVRLRGPHNRLNAMAAAAVTLARGMAPAAVREGLASFAGVAHRLEEIATLDGVLYINDSKATNVASAVAGLESLAGGVHVILGGRGKGGDYAPLAAPVAERARAAYLIGETAPKSAAALAGTGVPILEAGDLERALAAARRAARCRACDVADRRHRHQSRHPGCRRDGEHPRSGDRAPCAVARRPETRAAAPRISHQVTQRLQTIMQDRVMTRVLALKRDPKPPFAVKLLNRFRFLRQILARLVGLGFRPEHVHSPVAARPIAAKPSAATLLGPNKA